MSMFLYLLIAVTMGGEMWVIDILPNKATCENKVKYIQSLDNRPAHIYCTKILINPV